jgi:hypothetical protein
LTRSLGASANAAIPANVAACNAIITSTKAKCAVRQGLSVRSLHLWHDAHAAFILLRHPVRELDIIIPAAFAPAALALAAHAPAAYALADCAANARIERTACRPSRARRA